MRARRDPRLNRFSKWVPKYCELSAEESSVSETQNWTSMGVCLTQVPSDGCLKPPWASRANSEELTDPGFHPWSFRESYSRVD